MSEPKLIHICEVCGTEEILTPDEAYEAGWDYPPRMGSFGVLSPRTCPNCPIASTVWAAVMLTGKRAEELTPEQIAVVQRVHGEPESILPKAGLTG